MKGCLSFVINGCMPGTNEKYCISLGNVIIYHQSITVFYFTRLMPSHIGIIRYRYIREFQEINAFNYPTKTD